MRTREFLTWVADRLVYVHGDEENVDFVQKLRRIAAEDLPTDREELQKLLNAAYRKGNQDAHAARDILVKLLPEPSHEEWEALAAKSHIDKADMVDYLAGAAAYGLWLRDKLSSAKGHT